VNEARLLLARSESLFEAGIAAGHYVTVSSVCVPLISGAPPPPNSSIRDANLQADIMSCECLMNPKREF
jgi:hypothetical protein